MDLSEGQNVKVNARRARMQQLKEKCDRIIRYLRDGKHVLELTKNLQRAIHGQAKNYVWDESNKLLIILMLKMCHILAPSLQHVSMTFCRMHVHFGSSLFNGTLLCSHNLYIHVMLTK